MTSPAEVGSPARDVAAEIANLPEVLGLGIPERPEELVEGVRRRLPETPRRSAPAALVPGQATQVRECWIPNLVGGGF